MIAIEGEMREMLNSALADRMVCLVGTASKDGEPQISMKGSVSVYDGETLAYWERSMRSALENVNENPKVVIFYRNPDKRINWRFHGTATVHESGEIREKVKGQTPQPELDRDPDDKGFAILVKVDRITDLGGNIIQQKG
ncbi:MAG: pyridoxamine 5'-phosphate oxidase family protein [Chloroflexi bacterium]|nr:pyridoxamine 5'-phosphate oxidase family protein [Chloroflexota bacterium]